MPGAGRFSQVNLTNKNANQGASPSKDKESQTEKFSTNKSRNK
jgi:hypothetical protein